MVKEVGIGRKKWLFAEKDEGRVMEENVARYGALFPEKCEPDFAKAFSAACRQFGCLVTVHVWTLTNYSSNCILTPTGRLFPVVNILFAKL